MSFLTVEQLLKSGFEHHQAGRLGEAEKAYRQILLIDSQNPDALHLLGVLAQQAGQHQLAAEQISAAIKIDPLQAEFYYNLGNSRLHLKQFDRAAEAFAAAIKLSPQFFEAIRNLGSAQMLADRADDAADAFAAAAKLQPNAADVWNNLGMARRALGEVEEAIRCFQRARELQSAYRAAHDNYLYTLHFDPAFDAAAIFREHREWATAHADPLARPDVSLGTRVRSIAGCAWGMSRRTFASIRSDGPCCRCWSSRIAISSSRCATATQVSMRTIRSAIAFVSLPAWRDSARWTDAQLIEQIRQDSIDILVDTTLHMTGNRLGAFAQRAAPVQVTFIGYPATTGLTQIDYRITDEWLDPPGQSESANSEQLVRLSRSFWCYDADSDEPPVGERSVDGPITFGSLNNPAKISGPVIETWAKILAAIPGSRLMLYATAQSKPGEPIRRKFEALGIDPSRVLVVPRQPRTQYLKQYQQIDIALDPWPYNGHTTTCDALWMGVPVVSLIGQTSVARGGVSILSAMHLSELLASSIDQYVAIAVELARDRDRVITLRSSLRQRMRSSPLMDAIGFTTEVEKAYRAMWQRWMAS